MSWWCNISFHKIRRSRNLINLIPDRFPFLLILYTCVPLGIFNSEYPYVNILKYERSLIRSPLACVCELSEKKTIKLHTYVSLKENAITNQQYIIIIIFFQKEFFYFWIHPNRSRLFVYSINCSWLKGLKYDTYCSHSPLIEHYN